MANNIANDPVRWEALKFAVEQGWSLNEIRKTLGVCHKTVKRHYPDYAAFPRGGGGEAQIIRNANRALQRLDDFGNLRKRKANN